MTFTFTLSPILYSFSILSTLSQEISLICTKPSDPLIRTKNPNGSILLTSPSKSSPTENGRSIFGNFPASGLASFWEKINLFKRLSSSRILTLIGSLLVLFTFVTRWEEGIKPLIPS